jgi:hypothetical protein
MKENGLSLARSARTFFTQILKTESTFVTIIPFDEELIGSSLLNLNWAHQKPKSVSYAEIGENLTAGRRNLVELKGISAEGGSAVRPRRTSWRKTLPE